MERALTTARQRAGRLQRYGGRPTLVAIAAMNLITGLAALAVLAPLSFGFDARAFRRGATAIAEGHFDRDFLYSPLAGLAAWPLTWVSPEAAAAAMLAIGLAVLLVGVALETRRAALVDRVLVGIAATFFVPVVNELLLGQVTLLVAAALYPVIRGRDTARGGIALGIVLALAPKPFLIPILVWMLLRRPRALLAAVATGAALSAVGLVVMGPELYRQWLDILTLTGQVTRQGNLSLWTAGIQWPGLVVAVAVVISALWAIVRDEAVGLVAAMLAGLLLAPYTLLYSASILLLAVRPALGASPWATRALALVANPMVIAAFIPWALAGLAACLVAARGGAGRRVA